MMFRRIDDPHVLFESCPGSPDVIKWYKTVDDDGYECLKECGVESLYDEIQSHKDSVDIHVILAKYAAGDLSALSRRQGMYGDFSEVPTSLVEVIQMVNEAERTFMELPLDVRDSFDNSLAVWLAQYGGPDWMRKMRIDDDAPAPVPEKKEGEVVDQK